MTNESDAFHETAASDLLNTLRELKSHPELFALLKSEPAASEFALQQRLRKVYPDDVVRAAIQLCELRAKAQAKFRLADAMWLNRTGLEQATPEIVAQHKAARFHGRVLDLCCGIGGDSIALAGNPGVGEVVAVDCVESQCVLTRWNCEAYDVLQRATPVCGDATMIPLRDCLAHIDPDRRTGRGQRRTRRIEDCQPGLEFLNELQQRCPGGAIKLSPASNFPGKFPDAEIELISVDGECKEATVWFGELAGVDAWRATVLPANETITGDPLSAWTNVGPLAGYVLDPDPAVVRSGLVDLLCERLEVHRLDDAEEYLSASTAIESPFVRCFEVLADLPNNDRQIRRYFREHPFSDVEIKCRHIPINVDAIRRKLPLGDGTARATLFFAKVVGKTRAIVCRRLPICE